MNNKKHTLEELKVKQKLPLEVKIKLTKQRIKEWVDNYGLDNVYISFSGGKDSTVLLHIAREMFPTIKGVFVDTGLEYPEIREFVKTWDNITWLKPEKTFRQVIEEYGYPFISKQVSKRIQEWNNAIKKGKDVTKTYAYKEFMGISYIHNEGYDEPRKSLYNKEKWKFLIESPYKFSDKCCDVMKKKSFKTLKNNYPITGQMTEESINRRKSWLAYGCNAYDASSPISNPMSFWTEQDVYKYIYENKIQIASVYGDVIVNYDEMARRKTDESIYITTGLRRTGCMYCGYGCASDKPPGRFVRMKETHPKQYNYIMKPWDEGGLGYKEIIDWLNEHGNLDIKY